ncbi:MAG: hypothetical protein K5695_09090 [Oscillospiraceae bacterium]|nr:hypothetical protein [Oscillospiraceae bacterium]
MRKGRMNKIIAGVIALQFVMQAAFVSAGVTAFADDTETTAAITEVPDVLAADPAEAQESAAPETQETETQAADATADALNSPKAGAYDAFNDTITMSGAFQMPDTLTAGDAVEITGIVTSGISGLTSLTVGIYDSTGKFVTGPTFDPNTDRYDLSDVNGKVDFKSLEPGAYYFAVIASNSSKTNVTLMSKKFTVEAAAVEQPVEITGSVAFPSELAMGESYNVAGMVTSHAGEIHAISAAVYDASDRRVTGGTAIPRSMTYDLSRLNNLVSFDTLIAGKYTYRVVVTLAGGAEYTALENTFTVTGESEPDAVNDALTITGGTAIPDTVAQGTVVHVKGLVSSAASDITYLTCGVYDTSGRFVTGKSLVPRTKSYDLQRLDASVTISKLPEGKYTYVVIATNATNSFYPLVTKTFTVEAAASAAETDTLKAEGVTEIPETLRKGDAVSIRGTVTSALSDITSVTAGVYDSSGSFVTGKTADPYSTQFDLSKLDKYILFNKLTDGEFIFKVTATNGANANAVLVEKKFTIGAGSNTTPVDASADKLVLSGAFEMPASIRPGQSVSVVGAVTSYESDMRALTVGVYSAAGTFVTGKTINPKSNWYDLKNLDRYVAFGSLPEGDYVFAIIASNASQTNTSLMVKRFKVTADAPVLTDTISYLNGTNIPGNFSQGQDIELTGTITSAVSELTKVEVGIYNAAMEPVKTGTATPNAKSYDIKELSGSVSFDQLTDGVYFYKVSATNGSVTTLLANQQFTVGSSDVPSYGSDALTITGQGTLPSTLNLGQALSIAGTVTSASSNMTALTVGVYNEAGSFVTGVTINPKAKSFDLKRLDDTVEFNKLPAGTYTYAVIASNASNTNFTLLSKKITIVDEKQTGNDKLTITGATAVPSNLAVGQAVDIYGIVTSETSEMTALTVGVYDRAGSFRTGITINPHSSTYDLHNLDEKVEFDKLPAGSYVFAVIATNATQKNYALVNKSFTVGGESSETPGTSDDPITISGQNSVPSTITAGKALSIYGTVSSAKSYMTSLTCGVYDENGKFVTGKTINPNAKSYDLKKLDPYVAFNSLQPGTYTYAVIASNAVHTNKTLVRKKFTVTSSESGVVYGDGITIYGNTAIPSSVAKGKGVKVSGTITSGISDLRYVSVYIIDANGKQVTGASAAPHAKSYNIGLLDSSVCFDKLSTGTYYYRVTASNSSNASYTLINQSFVVV